MPIGPLPPTAPIRLPFCGILTAGAYPNSCLSGTGGCGNLLSHFSEARLR
jgi:hypothetical protein